MSRYFRWFAVATLAVASVFAVRAERNRRWQIVAAQDAIYQAKAQETSTAQADSRVILVSGKQINSEIHKVSEVGPGTFRVELMAYNAKTGGADVLRRTKPYRAEVHKRLVDMWYVIEGEGTLVTGGSLSESTQTEADEFRGPAIVGGEEHHIASGDFVRIPAGVPHWISKIEGKEIIYLVVKAPFCEVVERECHAGRMKIATLISTFCRARRSLLSPRAGRQRSASAVGDFRELMEMEKRGQVIGDRISGSVMEATGFHFASSAGPD